jgi:hypothetical protein
MLSVYKKRMKFNVFVVVRMKTTVFWDVTLRSLVESIYQTKFHHVPEICRLVLKE